MNYNTKKTIITTLLSCLFIAGIFTACDDDFTEEDALNAQQTIDLSIHVIDFFNTTSLQDVSVSVVQDGTTISGTTNEQGVATFTDIEIGGSIPVTVSRENYTTVQRLVSVNVTNFRQGQRTETIPVLSLTENTGTITGRLEIETDVTNEDTEIVPEGTEVTAILDIDDLNGINVIEITATTDANGFYELVVPATSNGINYELTYETLTLDQRIAKNGNEGDLDFPETLPSIDNISTVFNPRGSSVDVPSVPSLVAAVPAPANGRRAIITNVNTSSDGVITNINVFNTGSGYTGSEVAVTITSLFGGTGADITIPVVVGSNGQLSIFEDINDGGTGYPTFFEANSAQQAGPNFDFFVEVRTAEILTVNGDYGTGTFRSQRIQ